MKRVTTMIKVKISNHLKRKFLFPNTKSALSAKKSKLVN